MENKALRCEKFIPRGKKSYFKLRFIRGKAVVKKMPLVLILCFNV